MSSEEREGVVIVRGVATGFAQEIVAGPHQFVGDEPASVGGTGTARRRTTCCLLHWDRAPR